MSNTTKENGEHEQRGRRAYRSPAIEESGNFERLVLMCGHRPEDVTDPACEDLNATS